MSKIKFGPYTGRAYGSLPLTYQCYLTENLDKVSKLDAALAGWLLSKKGFIHNAVRKFSDGYFDEQIKLIKKFTKWEEYHEFKHTGNAGINGLNSTGKGTSTGKIDGKSGFSGTAPK